MYSRIFSTSAMNALRSYEETPDAGGALRSRSSAGRVCGSRSRAIV